MKHIKGMSIITNPIVNSYKRLVPGYEAPVYIAWSAKNRTPLIRIPAARGEETRIELRNPDPACNPYLTIALCLAAGLDGIKNKLECPDSIDMNIFEMSDEDKEKFNIEKLPSNLMEAINEFEKDEFIKGVLGEHISQKYVEAKKKEWENYSAEISNWEINQYLYKF